MTLALVAPQPLSQLKSMVESAFGSIPNRNREKPEMAWKGVAPFASDSIVPSFKHVVEIVPIQDLRQIQLSWPIVYQSDDDRQQSLLNKQADYISQLIGHEGPGSLLSYLKKKNWGNALAVSSDAEKSDFETFDVAVELTTQGLANVDKVVEYNFSYIQMLREQPIPAYIFSEVLQLAELEWRFLTKGGVASYAQSLAVGMQKYPDPQLFVASLRA